MRFQLQRKGKADEILVYMYACYLLVDKLSDGERCSHKYKAVQGKYKATQSVRHPAKNSYQAADSILNVNL